MKHLIETENPSGLAVTEYDRIILNSSTDDVIVRGGVYNANILMLSVTGYQLYGEEGDDGQINYWTFEYTGTEKYGNKEYFKYSLSETFYILAPTRNITKVTFPFDDYYIYANAIMALSLMGFDSLYGFTSVPENKILMKRRTDIGTNDNGKAYVDLGLTSGTLWATMNVGATSETDYGDYFMWGSTTPNTGTPCNWANAPFNNGSSKYNETYFSSVKDTVCPNGILAKEYDAAAQIMGGDWKMPTHALMEELMEETENTWVTDYNGTNINGREFSSKTDPTKHIFIPAVGHRFNSSFSLKGSVSDVWGSSLGIIEPHCAWFLSFSSSDIGLYCDTREYGRAVRGVL